MTVAGSASWPRVFAVAASYANFTELPPGSNRGQVVDRFTSFVGLDAKKGEPWCAAFVYYCGYWGLFDPMSRKTAWPMPKTAGCAELGEAAAEKHVLVSEPRAGDVFLIHYAKLKRFAHTGFVIGQNTDGTWLTIEGNTSKPGDTNPDTMREGWGVFQRSRTFGPDDRFVRWMDLV